MELGSKRPCMFFWSYSHPSRISQSHVEDFAASPVKGSAAMQCQTCAAWHKQRHHDAACQIQFLEDALGAVHLFQPSQVANLSGGRSNTPNLMSTNLHLHFKKICFILFYIVLCFPPVPSRHMYVKLWGIFFGSTPGLFSFRSLNAFFRWTVLGSSSCQSRTSVIGARTEIQKGTRMH